MGIADKLSKELMSWATLVIMIVIASLILVKFKNVTGVTAALNTTIDTFVTALSEPKNWITIVVVALIGFALFAMFKKLGKNR